MTNFSGTVVLAILSFFILRLPASAGVLGVLYDNGPINGTIDGWRIDSVAYASDSFTLDNGSLLTGAEIDLDVLTGYFPTTLDWGIGDAPFSSNEGSGHTVLLYLQLCHACAFGNAVDLYTATISLPGIPLNPGTYYLTLQNGSGTTANGTPIMYWDINNGPSAAYVIDPGIGPGIINVDGLFPTQFSNSSAFQILGIAPGTTSTPEPGSSELSGLGLVICLFTARARKRASQRQD
jgi:hypothetical protein